MRPHFSHMVLAVGDQREMEALPIKDDWFLSGVLYIALSKLPKTVIILLVFVLDWSYSCLADR